MQVSRTGRFPVFALVGELRRLQVVDEIMRVVFVPEYRIVVGMDLDDRHACAGNGDDKQGENRPAGTFADCAQTAHSAPTVPDSHQQFKRLSPGMTI